eukprot:1149543-Pelagomonas_calceolata.AAC.6
MQRCSVLWEKSCHARPAIAIRAAAAAAAAVVASGEGESHYVLAVKRKARGSPSSHEDRTNN